MLNFDILFPSLLNGLTTGAVYALVALGLTLIYGVLHIINFAHGASLMLALYGVYLLNTRLGWDPYLCLPLVVAGMFALGYALQRGVINRASHGKDENILLITLGLAIVMENLALLAFSGDTRTIDTPYTLRTVAIGPAMIALPKVIAFAGALAVAGVLLWIVKRTDLGRAIRAVAKEKLGAQSRVPDGVKSIMEIVINGSSLAAVAKATYAAIDAALKAPGLVKITAGNYGGRLGKSFIYLNPERQGT